MRFNIASLDQRILIQTLYVYASASVGDREEDVATRASGEVVPALSLRHCKRIVYRRTKSSCGVDYVKGKALKVSWKRITNSLTIFDSTEYDLLHGRYRALEAMLAAFGMHRVKIVDRGYWGLQARVFGPGWRVAEVVFERLLEEAVLVCDECDNPHWTLVVEEESGCGAGSAGAARSAYRRVS